MQQARVTSRYKSVKQSSADCCSREKSQILRQIWNVPTERSMEIYVVLDFYYFSCAISIKRS